jgi:hypothetical protein
MIKVFAAPLLALMLTTFCADQAPAREAVGVNRSEAGREVAAPSWSAACMTDHGPNECGEPVWVYGNPAAVSHYRNAF